jgi:hypothetical protein
LTAGRIRGNLVAANPLEELNATICDLLVVLNNRPFQKHMRLYYMTSERWGSVDLARKHLKFARFDDLNDPFELLSAHLGERPARRFYKKLKTAVADRFGVICFSDNWRSPVMWAHYGEKHKGLCLGFDVKAAAQVKYEPERLKHKLDQTEPGVRIAADLMKIAMTTKFDEWKYEHEWRVFKELPISTPMDTTTKSLATSSRCAKSSSALDATYLRAISLRLWVGFINQ